MEAPKLNEECCFSCLQAFDSSRSEINISENTDALKRILEINFLSNKCSESMNLCIPCYDTFKEAKAEYLQLKEVEKRFNSKRRKFAFTIVKSVVDDDYLGTSIEDNFLNARAKIYSKWHTEYKEHAADEEDVTEKDGGRKIGEGETVIARSKAPVKELKKNPIISSSALTPIVKKVVSLQNGFSGHKESAPVQQNHLKSVTSAPGNVSVSALCKQKVFFVKSNAVSVSGNMLRMKSAGPEGCKTVNYRINSSGAFQSSAIRVVTPQTRAQSLFQINKDGNVVKHSNSVVQPQARPIVRTPIPTPTRFVPVAKPLPKVSPPIVLARKSLPVVAAPIKRTASENNVESSGDTEHQNTPEKKSRRESISPTAAESTTQLSNRSRRIIRKPVDSSCLYGNEYERAVKNSSKKKNAKVRTMKRTSNSAVDMNEDSYRYGMEDQDEIDEGTIDQFENDGDMAQASDNENE